MDRILNTCITIENILGLYRNYTFITKSRHKIFVVQIVLEIINGIFVFPSYITSIKLSTDYVYLFFSLFNYLLSFILCLYNSKLFNNLSYYLKVNNHILKRDKIYKQNLRKKCKNIIVVLIIYISLTICNIYSKSLNKTKNYSELYAEVFTSCFLDMHLLSEYLIVYGLLAILSEQYKCIIRNFNTKTLIFDNIADEVGKETKKRGKTFNEWQTIYINIKKSSDLLNAIFSSQVTTFI